MFGYLMPYKPEMRIKEFESYRAVYCGLCKQLNQDYGAISRMLLNYDMVLLSLLADGLSGQQGKPELQRCIANPKKRCMLTDTRGLRLAADCTVLASCYKLRDDKQDEHLIKSQLAGCGEQLLHKAFIKAKIRQPKINQVMQEAMVNQMQVEAQKTKSYDIAADATARMTAEMFAQCSYIANEQQVLYRLGIFIGKIIYYLDAAEDYQKDKQHNRYNVFLENGFTHTRAIEITKAQCFMAVSAAAECYQKLQFRLNKPLWDNILYLGIPFAIQNAGKARHKTAKHPK